ncbi:Xaa-Pro dipeptidase [Glaciecola sp. 1036]|uniref:Xaa-Pro dipeptidase n=1 Tax=Alteromonadaceae TaxID=72275 RepID=UPI003D017469
MSYPEIDKLYRDHIQELQVRAREALDREGIDGIIIHSGQLTYQFLDDNAYPFKVNPHFKAWLPIIDNPNSWLVVNGVDKPKLIFYRPVDFWHKVPDEPEDFWVEHFDIVYLKHANNVEKFLPYDRAKYAYLGEHIEVAQALGISIVNPDKLIHYLHWKRAYKTDYELACMREANRVAVLSHKAAALAFARGMSEFEIYQAYLRQAKQGENEMPYNGIVALNKNASILHYMVQDKIPPDAHLSFLIDAGASFRGYAADITRTYTHGPGPFEDLIVQVDELTQKLAAALKPGIQYTSIHEQAFAGIAQILFSNHIVNLTAEGILEQDIVGTFFPHGIGHFLGLQVHDVGGHFADDRGTPKPAPEAHPFLRCTREVEAGQVFTIEPGLYFIDSLLADLQSREESKFINWNVVEKLKPYGGIRIEDNVIVHKDRNENMTRELW